MTFPAQINADNCDGFDSSMLEAMRQTDWLDWDTKWATMATAATTLSDAANLAAKRLADYTPETARRASIEAMKRLAGAGKPATEVLKAALSASQDRETLKLAVEVARSAASEARRALHAALRSPVEASQIGAMLEDDLAETLDMAEKLIPAVKGVNFADPASLAGSPKAAAAFRELEDIASAHDAVRRAAVCLEDLHRFDDPERPRWRIADRETFDAVRSRILDGLVRDPEWYSLGGFAGAGVVAKFTPKLTWYFEPQGHPVQRLIEAVEHRGDYEAALAARQPSPTSKAFPGGIRRPVLSRS